MRTRHVLIGAIRIYQRVVSPYIGDCCRFHPSCSEYAIGTLRENGAVVGAFDAAWRILRCHPFNPGGVDLPRRIQPFGTRAQWKKG